MQAWVKLHAGVGWWRYKLRFKISLRFATRVVIRLGYQVGRIIFWEKPKFFKLCPTHFPGVRRKKFFSAPPWLRAYCNCLLCEPWWSWLNFLTGYQQLAFKILEIVIIDIRWLWYFVIITQHSDLNFLPPKFCARGQMYPLPPSYATAWVCANTTAHLCLQYVHHFEHGHKLAVQADWS